MSDGILSNESVWHKEENCYIIQLMPYIIAGLGNPEQEYENTRHNTGRILAAAIAKKFSFPEFKQDIKLRALVSKGKIGDESVMLLEPDNYMNRSGASIALLFDGASEALKLKKAKNLIVIYDDLDLPIGTIKISFNKSSGGHRGLESIIKALKTEAFIRIRVGISPVTPSGKLKKPKGEEAVTKQILGEFKKSEAEALKEVSKKVIEAVELIIIEGLEKTTSTFKQ